MRTGDFDEGENVIVPVSGHKPRHAEPKLQQPLSNFFGLCEMLQNLEDVE
jgi:hypothetical protein